MLSTVRVNPPAVPALLPVAVQQAPAAAAAEAATKKKTSSNLNWFFYASIVCKKAINKGMVTTENNVQRATIFTDISVSLSNFTANMLVSAAVGAEAPIRTTPAIKGSTWKMIMIMIAKTGMMTNLKIIGR